jgi:hypothetical protein
MDTSARLETLERQVRVQRRVMAAQAAVLVALAGGSAAVAKGKAGPQDLVVRSLRVEDGDNGLRVSISPDAGIVVVDGESVSHLSGNLWMMGGRGPLKPLLIQSDGQGASITMAHKLVTTTVSASGKFAGLSVTTSQFMGSAANQRLIAAYTQDDEVDDPGEIVVSTETGAGGAKKKTVLK